MTRETGVTTETAKRMVMDAGAVYINYGETDERLLGATREGSEFSIEQTVRQIEVDGLRGPTKGFRRVTEETVRLTVNLLEMTGENLATILVGATSDAHATDPVDIVTRSMALADVEYLTNIALVADYSGTSGTEPVVITLYNALADGGLALSAEDRNEVTTEVQFTAHIDPANSLDASPFEIRFPQVTV